MDIDMKNEMKLWMMKAGALSLLLLTLPCLRAKAQEPAAAPDSTVAAAQTPPDRGFDAGRYSMQKRYRPANAREFVSERFQDNIFLSGALGGYYSFRGNYGSGTQLFLSAGKWFNAFNAARLSLGLGGYTDNYDAMRVSDVGLKATYLFNATGYLGGYNPERFAHIWPLAGIGVGFLSREGNSGVYLSMHLGFNASFRVGGRFSLFVEPVYDVATDALSTKRDNNWREYVSALNVKVGVTYDFFNDNIDARSLAPRMYWFGSLGGQVQNSSLVQQGGNALKTIRGALNAGAGFECLDWLDFRASLFGSTDLWDGDTSVMQKYAIYGGVRAEALFDLLVARDSDGAKKFGVGVLVGPEFGYMYKMDEDVAIKGLYAGLTAGLHIRYRIGGSPFCIYVEPRTSIVPYSGYTDNYTTINDFRNYYDTLLNLCIGVEYRR